MITYQVLLKTATDNLFTITLDAVNESDARSQAKRLSKGCTIVKIEECSSQDTTGIGQTTYLMA
jgi:hypothetical protein